MIKQSLPGYTVDYFVADAFVCAELQIIKIIAQRNCLSVISDTAEFAPERFVGENLGFYAVDVDLLLLFSSDLLLLSTDELSAVEVLEVVGVLSGAEDVLAFEEQAQSVAVIRNADTVRMIDFVFMGIPH